MEVVSINGVEYTKAAKLAKQFKYTADYIGQLCRGRKVDAKLVGRTWYVSEVSLTDHKNGRHAALRTGEKTIVSSPVVDTSRTEVARPLDKKTLRSLPPLNKISHFARHIEWKPVKYEADDSALLPALKPPVRLPVAIADAVPVAIRGHERPVVLEAEPLPEVSLHGTLRVGSLDDDFEINEENIAMPGIVDGYEDESATNDEPLPEAFKPKVIARSSKAFTYGVKIRQASGLDQVALTAAPVPATNFTPARMQGTAVSSRTATISASKDTTASNSSPRLLYVLLLVVFLLLVSAVIFIDLAIEATSSEFNFGVSLTSLSVLKF